MKYFLILTSLLFLNNCASPTNRITPELTTYMKKLQNEDIPIMITKIGVSKPNTVGGRDIIFRYNVTSKKILSSDIFEKDGWIGFYNDELDNQEQVRVLEVPLSLTASRAPVGTYHAQRLMMHLLLEYIYNHVPFLQLQSIYRKV